MNPALLRAGGRIATAGALVALLAATSISNAPQPPDGPEANQLLGGLPLSFVENRGQWDTPARFVAKRGPMVARLEQDALVVELRDGSDPENPKTLVLRLAFEGVREDVRLEGEGQQPGVRNYFLGNDPEAWRSGVPGFDSVLYRGLHEGIDLRVRDRDGRLEYDLLLAPGADLSRFTVRCEGIEGIAIEPEGSLVLETALGPVRQTPPATWYVLPSGDREPVDCRFVLVDEGRYGFEIPARDPGLPVVIDPGIEWATYLGGSSSDAIQALGVDSAGGVIVAGGTFSSDFPVTAGAFDETPNGGSDGFVACLDPALSGSAQLCWSTYLGGSEFDSIWRLVLDSSGSVYVTGETLSEDFPTTPLAYDTIHNGERDAFVARLDATGSRLHYSTFLGGDITDRGLAIDLYGPDTVAVGGRTRSMNFPTTVGAFQVSHGGGRDAFMAILDTGEAGAAGLAYSTFLGGDLAEGLHSTDLAAWMGISVDATGDVVLTSCTRSENFPVTTGAVFSGGQDIFVSRLDPAGNGPQDLEYSTLVGGGGASAPLSVVAEPDGRIAVSGETTFPNFPTTPGAVQEIFGGHFTDAVWFRLDPAQPWPAELVYSTFLGSSTHVDALGDFEFHASGDVIGVGNTGQNVSTPPNDFPTTCQAFDPTYNGRADGFVVRFTPGGNGPQDLVYSTFLGGPLNDFLTMRMALVSTGPEPKIVTACGSQGGGGFPTTPDAFQPTFQGVSDGVVVLMELAPQWSTYCSTAPNSIGPGALIGNSCSVSITENTFTLSATRAIPGQSGLFYYGPEQQQVPFGDGFQCVAPGTIGLFRLNPPLVIDGSGGASRLVDFTQPPADAGPGQITAGSTWNFQFWYRDPDGPGGTTFNLSDALSVTFTP